MGANYNPLNGAWDVECPHEGKGWDTELLKYNWSWDWLMPVVHKCLAICHENMWNEWEAGFSDALFTCHINGMYKEAVEFIQWYNKNKP